VKAFMSSVLDGTVVLAEEGPGSWFFFVEYYSRQEIRNLAFCGKLCIAKVHGLTWAPKA
jgi:hypothetical protein